MSPRQQVAFQPSLAQMFAQYFHDSAVGAQLIVDRNNLGHGSVSLASNTALSRLEFVSSGQNTRKFFGFVLKMSRKKSPSLRGASAITSPGRGSQDHNP